MDLPTGIRFRRRRTHPCNADDSVFAEQRHAGNFEAIDKPNASLQTVMDPPGKPVWRMSSMLPV